MATQLFSTQSYNYIVLDNSAAPASTVLNCNTHIGYDVTWPGATAQNSNVYGNGNIPDFLKSGTAISTGLVLVNLTYKNPS